MPADAGIDDVGTRRFHTFGQHFHFIPALAVFHQIHQRHAINNDELATHRRTHLTHHFHGKPRSVFRTAAPLVGALVGACTEELVEQITFRSHDFNAIVTSQFGQLGSAGEIGDGAFHLLAAHFPRLERRDRRLDARRRHTVRRVTVTARMQQLQHDLATFVVHLAGDMAMQHRGDLAVHARPQRQQFTAPVGGIAARHDDAHAAPRPLGKITGQLVDMVEAILQPRVHGAHQHAIAQRGEAQIQGLQQVRVKGVHGISSLRKKPL